ncbi:MAG: immunoglobulin domain-containing protein, partial [Verrucomicrobiales bacterium]|nr:immunoglobulin domain-containing protein [Verrucomicrobiales bacterium]
FGYDSTGINENSLIDFGGDPRNKILTYYFRKKFTIATEAELDAIGLATVNLVRDDGAVVYINGNEVGRSNIAALPTVITSTTRAGGTIGSETADNPLAVNTAFLKVGENVVTVEVHQSSPTSSDVSFDLSLVVEDAIGTPTDLISKQSDWRYLDDGSALDPSNVVTGNPAFDSSSWKHPDFDDSGWPTGFGELGYGDGSGTPQAFTTELEYGVRLNKYPTAYFRAGFNASLADLAGFDDIEIRYRRDDGVVIYVNGTEVVRDNMGAGTINRDSAAVGNAADDGATFASAIIPKSVIKEGNNIIAAELHQSLPAGGGGLVTSSDTVFDLVLAGVSLADSATYTLSATNADGTTEAQTTVNFIDPPEGKVFLTTSNVAGLDWGMSGVWSDGMIPDPDTDYIVYPSFAPVVRVPDGGFFEGGSLEIAGKYGVLAMNGTGDLVHLIMNGGQIWNEAGGGDISGLGFPGEFGTRIEILDEVLVQNRGSNRTLDISGNLEGAGSIRILAPNTNTNTNPPLTAVILSGGNVAYTGTITAFDSVMANDGPNLGSGSVVIGDGAFLSAAIDFENAATASIEITANGGIELSNLLRIATGKLTIGGNPVADGVYSGAALDAL